MNKTKKSIKKPLRERVFHLVLPVKVWNKFESWRTDAGFSTATEAVRFLIRKEVGLLIALACLSGCGSIKADGFSVGALYLNTDVSTSTSHSLGYFGQATSKQTTKIEEIVPIILFNFKFK